MPFAFPLEAVLRLRRAQERGERLKLEAIVSEQAQARRRLEDLTAQYFDSHRDFLRRMGEQMSGAELELETLREERAAAVRQKLRNLIADLEEQRLEQVEVFRKTRQSREVHENLRSRKFDLYRQTLSRREQQALDDLFLMRQESRRDD